MGCDIHLFVEKKHKGKWVMVHEVDGTPKSGHGDGRNYYRFAALAGVRGDGPEPKGLPDDVSESVALHAEEWGIDGHSHSWMSVRDAVPIFSVMHFPDQVVTDYEKKYPAEHFFGVDDLGAGDRSIDNYRIVFWFDN